MTWYICRLRHRKITNKKGQKKYYPMEEVGDSIDDAKVNLLRLIKRKTGKKFLYYEMGYDLVFKDVENQKLPKKLRKKNRYVR